MATNVVMPLLGESVIEGTLGRWLVNIGDTVKEFDPLVEVETDKVTTEVPAPVSGVLLETYVQEGDVVAVGAVMAVIGEAGESPGDQPAPQAEPAPAVEPALIQAAAAAGVASHAAGSNGGNGQPRISPVVARIAAEHSINVDVVEGTGLHGRVTKKDMLAYIEQLETGTAPAPAAPMPAPAPAPIPSAAPQLVTATPADHVHQAPPAAGRPGELVQLSNMRKRIAEHMVMSKLQTAPHVTTVFEADLSAIGAHRAENKAEYAARGVNLTFTAYFIAAIAHALRKHPMVNSKWTDEGVYLYPDVNVGMAVAIDDGLIVPVIKHADELSLAGIARQVNDLANRARNNQLKPDDITGATFTLTNHGVSGSLFATPIINQPQTGILGAGAIQKRVVVTADDAIAIRPMMYITLTFDHRVLDGAGADWFVVEIKNMLEHWSD